MRTWRATFALVWILGTVLAVNAAAFEQRSLRYLSGHDVFRVLSQKFPKAVLAADDRCVRAAENSVNALGFADPIQGRPYFSAPPLSFVRWYGGCVERMVDLDIRASLAETTGFKRYLGREAVQRLEGTALAIILMQPDAAKWGQLSEELRYKIMLNLVSVYVGPQVLESQNFVVHSLLQAVQRKGSQNVLTAVRTAIFLICTRDEFLTY